MFWKRPPKEVVPQTSSQDRIKARQYQKRVEVVSEWVQEVMSKIVTSRAKYGMEIGFSYPRLKPPPRIDLYDFVYQLYQGTGLDKEVATQFLRAHIDSMILDLSCDLKEIGVLRSRILEQPIEVPKQVFDASGFTNLQFVYSVLLRQLEQVKKTDRMGSF